MVKKVIEIDVDVLNAKGGIDGLIKSFDEAEKSTKSLKQQMREAQNEVAELSEKFGATSDEAVKAAKRAGELRDRIGDAKSLTEAFNPDAKFNALSSSLSGVASGFAAYQGALTLAGVESKDLEQQLLRVQSAMALAQGLQGLGEARDSFKQLKAVAIDAFKGIKTAIGSTGIGLLVIALGTVYAYWDDIKEAVSGVSEEQKKLNADSQKNVDLQNEKLKSIGAQDNILKLQGKSEKEILAIKIKQTDEAILATEINQKNQIQTNKLAVEGAKNNYDLLRSYIDFISTPLRFLYENGAKAINGIIDLINNIPGINIKGKLDEKFGDQAADFITKLAFDPEKVKADGEATIKESQQVLTQLKNDRAGYRLAINDINKKEAQDAILTEEEKQKKLKELNDKYKKELAKQPVEEIDTTELQKLDELNQAKRDLLKANNDKILDDHTQFQLKVAQTSYDSIDGIKAREKELAETKRILREQDLALTAQTFGKISELLGKNSKAGKAFAVSQALINTYQGITAELATKAATPFEFGLKLVNIASVVGIGFKAVKDILKTPAMSTSGGGASVGGGGGAGGGGAISAPQFNVVGNTGINQIAQTMNREQMPVQAYVVGNKVTSQQALDRNIVDNASL